MGGAPEVDREVTERNGGTPRRACFPHRKQSTHPTNFGRVSSRPYSPSGREKLAEKSASNAVPLCWDVMQ